MWNGYVLSVAWFYTRARITYSTNTYNGRKTPIIFMCVSAWIVLVSEFKYDHFFYLCVSGKGGRGDYMLILCSLIIRYIVFKLNGYIMANLREITWLRVNKYRISYGFWLDKSHIQPQTMGYSSYHMLQHHFNLYITFM